MKKYTVKALSKLAGISVRTLHHYDKIGLLQPSSRTEKGYRIYERADLLRLQQILFYKELDFSLKEIKAILEDPSFDLIAALEFHKTQIRQRSSRLQELLKTIDKTIAELKNQITMLTDKELYEGFNEKEVKAMRKEVIRRWGEKELLEVEERIRKMSKEGWQDVKQKGEEINQLLADLMDHPPADAKVQEAIALHHRHLCHYYEVSEERYRGLGKMYVEDERFKAHYDKYRPGLADFIQKAITVFCDNGSLKVS